MEETTSELARETIFEVIQNQIRDKDPQITKITYDRLILDGHSHENTMELLGSVMSAELFEMLKNSELYNEERYAMNLNRLPDMPWDDKK